MIMISYQLARPFHFYSINILAALKRLWPKSCNKIYMAWIETGIFFLWLKNNYIHTHPKKHNTRTQNTRISIHAKMCSVHVQILKCYAFLKCHDLKNSNTKPRELGFQNTNSAGVMRRSLFNSKRAALIYSSPGRRRTAPTLTHMHFPTWAKVTAAITSQPRGFLYLQPARWRCRISGL